MYFFFFKEVEGKDHYVSKIGIHFLDLLAQYENNLTFESLETRFIIAKTTIQKRDKTNNNISKISHKSDHREKKDGINSDYLHQSSSSSTGPNGITPSGAGFNFFRVKNEILVVYPDFTSFISEFLDGVEEDAPDNIETVDLGELYELFGYRPVIDKNGLLGAGVNGNNNSNNNNEKKKKKNSINNINNDNNDNKNYIYDLKFCIENIYNGRIKEPKKILKSDIKNKNTYNNSSLIFAPKIPLCTIGKIANVHFCRLFL